MENKLELAKKAIRTFKTEGTKETLRKIRSHVIKRKESIALQNVPYEMCADVLFINGCDPVAAPHPPRYRVSHQKEQLFANNITCGEVYYTQLQMNQVYTYRAFIFFRCPYTQRVGDFIAEAKRLHKPVFFDIDDLVIDTKYTDTIPYVQGLNEEEKAVYDDGVNRMGQTLRLCDAAITTTERLAEELSHYVSEVFINRNTASEKMYAYSEEARRRKPKKPDEQVDIGYFSGSITHNTDFEMIMPVLVRVMRENPKVRLHVVGELDVPNEMKDVEKQIVRRKFVDWEKLPELIASVDVNLAPITVSIFNEAKSENKWVEAALVDVPTIASDFGAFRRMIEHGVTGVLCGTEKEWYAALKKLTGDAAYRKQLAENAHAFCKKHCLTMYSGYSLSKYIRSKLTPNIAFVLPSLEISGGIIVALKHAQTMFKSGYDVLIISEVPGSGWIEYKGDRFPVVSKNHHPICMHFDKAVATMWTTVQFLETYSKIRERYYLVQSFEVDFYQPNVVLRIQANQSYLPDQDIRFLTISKWCQKWLAEDYERQALYIRNGIDAASFHPRRRDLSKEKIRILIEGDSESYYKNVDESFRIVQKLDLNKFEIWYMSYNGQPKDWYRVDRFLQRVNYQKVWEVYAQCDILIKSSFLESFSYPPLEMMASGGYAVVVPNDGNVEYLVDRENCLMYERGKVNDAVRRIVELIGDRVLQDKLYCNGLQCARERDWLAIEPEILAAYECE